MLQILDELVEAVIVRINGFGFYMHRLFRFEQLILLYHAGQQQRRALQDAENRLLTAVKQICLGRQHVAAFQTALHGQGKLLLIGSAFLLHPMGLVNENHRIFRQIIQKRRCFLIKIRQQSFTSGCGAQGREFIFCRFNHFPKSFLFLTFLLFFKYFCLPGVFLLHPPDGLRHPVLRKNHLRRRINAYFVQILNASLTLHIEGAHGINLIAPQLNADRTFLCQRENVHNVAPHRKLARAFHQSAALVSHLHQSPPELIGFYDRIQADGQTGFLKRLRRNHFFHEYVKAENDGQRLPLRHTFQHPHTLHGRMVAVHVRAVKQNILGRIVHGVPVKKAQILVHFPGLFLFPGHDQTAGRFFSQIGDKMAFLGVHTAGNPHRIPALFLIFFYFPIFTQPPQRFR